MLARPAARPSRARLALRLALGPDPGGALRPPPHPTPTPTPPPPAATRRCSPRIESIRAATADLLTGSGPIPVTISLWRRGTAQSVQVAGLDVGWHSRIDLAENPKTHRLEVGARR